MTAASTVVLCASSPLLANSSMSHFNNYFLVGLNRLELSGREIGLDLM